MWPWRRTRVVRQVAVSARSLAVPQARAAGAGPPDLPGALGWGLVQDRGDLQPGGPGDALVQALEILPGVCGVADHVDGACGITGGDPLGRLPRERDLPGVAGPPQPRQDRQTHRPGQERQVHRDPRHHEAGAVAHALGSPGRAVVLPTGAEHLLAAAFEQGVVDRDGQRRVRGKQQSHGQVAQRQAEPVGGPARQGEEPVSPAVVPDALQARAHQHPAHRAPPGLCDQAHRQSGEGAMRRSGETGPELLQ